MFWFMLAAFIGVVVVGGGFCHVFFWSCDMFILMFTVPLLVSLRFKFVLTFISKPSQAMFKFSS